jgi:DNA repair exonuclease SbcCD ATPase subunit
MANTASKIVKFEVNNMMAVRFAEVEFDEAGGLVVVGGENGSGKSSLIMALQFVFGGKKAIDKDPLRYGAEKGFVNVELGGRPFTIRRTINDKGGETLTVKGPDGKAIKSPQRVLNELMGAVGIDPSIIWSASDAEISKKLRDAMGIDLTKLDAKEKDAFERRSLANRTLKHSTVAVEGAETFDDVPQEKTSMSALLKEFKEGEAQNKARGKHLAAIDANTQRRSEIDKEVDKKEKEIAALKEEREELIVRDEELEGILNDTVDIDLNEIGVRMGTVEAVNNKIDANLKAAGLKEELENDKARVEELNKEVEAIRQEKLEVIAAAEFPLEGVEFDHNGQMTMDGKPWHAWSDGERLLASFEISAAMAPNLKAVVMRQGSLFDDEAKKVIAEIAQERGYLVLMEVVGDSDEVSIYMVDGQMTDRRG